MDEANLKESPPCGKVRPCMDWYVHEHGMFAFSSLELYWSEHGWRTTFRHLDFWYQHWPRRCSRDVTNIRLILPASDPVSTCDSYIEPSCQRHRCNVWMEQSLSWRLRSWEIVVLFLATNLWWPWLSHGCSVVQWLLFRWTQWDYVSTIAFAT